jgi:hypothetical protein
MNLQKTIVKALLIVCGFIFSSCVANKLSPRPVYTKPPAKIIHATSDFSIGDGFFMKKFIYPSGVYQPIHEDEKAHYFAPPGEQIRVKDTGMNLGTQGGIYWEKGLPSPKKVYFTGNFGIKLPWNKSDMPITIKQ